MRSLLAVAVALLLLPLAGCPQPPPPCDCFVCESAVTLSVVDPSGGAVEGFVVEAVVNDVPQGEPSECTVEARAERGTPSSCSFGTELGVYHLIVSAPGFRSREAVVRVASQAGSDICCMSCLTGREITVELEPL